MKNKRGVSLIVLVITIIVMIILASAVILSLDNAGIIDKSQEAVEKTNLKEVQHLATLKWTDAFLKGTTTREGLAAAVKEGLEEEGINLSWYGVTVTEKGVDVEIMPSGWSTNVTNVVDGVPIPKGFAVSPYGADRANNLKAENTKAGGLVIYELTATEMANGATTLPSAETQYESWTTRNQYVWVPVDDFKSQFVRSNFGNSDVLSNTPGTDWWEVQLDLETNLPTASQKSSLFSSKTLTEVQAMYASVQKYGGFYIARYEAGIDTQRTSAGVARVKTLANVHSKMNKIPYNYLGWSSGAMNLDTGGAVEIARSLYPDDSTNKTGVVSTLTYEVQLDRALQWYVDTGIVLQTELLINKGNPAYGNFSDHDVSSYTELNTGARYTTSATTTYSNVTSSYKKGSATTNENHILTTGALKAANMNNIYDLFGNMWERTMGGNSAGYRVLRGGGFENSGTTCPTSRRWPDNANNAAAYYSFRPSLYIKL